MTVRLPSFSKMKIPHLRQLAHHNGLVLVSGSPRRKLILEKCQLAFQVEIPDIDEKSMSEFPPERMVILLAEQKVKSVKHDNERAYLGSDTIVLFENRILNKPHNDTEAAEMLSQLSGQTHSVLTGLALYDSRYDDCYTSCEESRVTFKAVSHNQISEYIATGEPSDKAGAYGIQGMGRFLVDTVDGSVDNVIGLPVDALERLASIYREKYVR